MPARIGFVSTRFAGTDGVSLEATKWAQVLSQRQHLSFWFAGKNDRSPAICSTVPEAYFGHPEIEWVNQRVFGVSQRSSEATRVIYDLADKLKHALYEFVRKFEIDLMIVQNASAIPMNVPLGIAIAHFIAETGFPTIAHHHDFYWERDRFTINGIADILGMAFPPALPTIQHATINTPAQSALARRTGVSSTLIPNVLDFANAPPALDDYSTDFRQSIGLTQDDILFLQPTRVVPRKGIEHAIQLVAAVKDPRCKLIISHESGDEGHAYLSALTEMAAQQGVDMRIVATKVSENRATDAAGSKIYTLADAYSHADFITYPSLYEGFGNALLEAFYFKKPVLVNRYSIYISDIEPKGFDVIAMSGYITRDTVEHVRKVIRDDAYRQRMVDHNYEVAKKFFSYEVLRRKLQALVANLTGNDLW